MSEQIKAEIATLVGDGTGRLCRALYGRKATARDYVGGSEAKMLHDAADRIAQLKGNGVLAHARAAERDQECFRLEDELKGALELINAQNANAVTLRDMFGQAEARARAAEAKCDALREALAAEREECAKVADAASERQSRLVSANWKDDDEFKHRYAGEVADTIAEDIRARALTQETNDGE